MCVCHDCGAEFDEPFTYRENHGPEIGYETWRVCPECESSDWEETSIDLI